METNQPILRLEGFEKTFYLHAQGKSIPSAQQVNLEVFPGQLTALVGPTGSGKSSVLKGIYRTYLSSAGEIWYHTKAGEQIDIAQAQEHQVLELRKSEIGFVTQFLHVPPRRTTLQLVAEPMTKRGVGHEEANQQAGALLDSLQLPQRLWELPPSTFSGGEKQRVNLARGFAAQPRLLLLDEPTASLDPATSELVVQHILKLKDAGTALLAIFHHPELVERLGDVIVRLEPPKETQSTQGKSR